MSTRTEPAEAALAATGETPEIADAVSVQSRTTLQEVLPDINALAARVGGLDQLAELIATLKTSKE